MNNEEKEIKYKGDLFELVSTVVYSTKSNKIRIFEKAHRPPGVRMLFVRDNKILLSREFRRELDEWDYRLPGGKVFDDFHSYAECLDDNNLFEQKLEEAVIRESREEVGLIVNPDDVYLLHKSVAGSSVKWDLFYFKVSNSDESKDGQELEEGEKIDKPIWVEKKKVVDMCLSGKINEDRSVAVLLRYLLNKK